jgi:hypothetical protein
MFIDERDIDIGQVVFNFFQAIKEKWPRAWDNREKGHILNKTNGFRALMRTLGPAYNRVAQPRNVPSIERFDGLLRGVKVDDDHFTVDRYIPGTGGEAALRSDFADWLGLDGD